MVLLTPWYGTRDWYFPHSKADKFRIRPLTEWKKLQTEACSGLRTTNATVAISAELRLSAAPPCIEISSEFVVKFTESSSWIVRCKALYVLYNSALRLFSPLNWWRVSAITTKVVSSDHRHFHQNTFIFYPCTAMEYYFPRWQNEVTNFEMLVQFLIGWCEWSISTLPGQTAHVNISDLCSYEATATLKNETNICGFDRGKFVSFSFQIPV